MLARGSLSSHLPKTYHTTVFRRRSAGKNESDRCAGTAGSRCSPFSTASSSTPASTCHRLRVPRRPPPYTLQPHYTHPPGPRARNARLQPAIGHLSAPASPGHGLPLRSNTSCVAATAERKVSFFARGLFDQLIVVAEDLHERGGVLLPVLKDSRRRRVVCTAVAANRVAARLLATSNSARAHSPRARTAGEAPTIGSR